MAMQEHDGTWGDVKKSSEIMDELLNRSEVGDLPKTVVFGTRSEVDEAIAKADLSGRMDVIEEKVEELTPQQTLLYTPTKAEMKAILGER